MGKAKRSTLVHSFKRGDYDDDDDETNALRLLGDVESYRVDVAGVDIGHLFLAIKNK